MTIGLIDEQVNTVLQNRLAFRMRGNRMIRTLKSEEGITLIELMASLAILSIVILLVGSVHIFGQTQFINQTETASQSNDLRYSLSLVSRDVRQAGLVVKDHENETYIIGPNSYSFQKPNLSRNNELTT